MKIQYMKTFVLGLSAVALAACGSTEAPEANPRPQGAPEGGGLFSGASGNLVDIGRAAREQGITLAVNGYLWRASLETLSFMPLQEVDSTGGVITTDWYIDPATPDERIRAQVLVLGTTLHPTSIKANVFKQEQESAGWGVETAQPDTARQLEDAILTGARDLRAADVTTR